MFTEKVPSEYRQLSLVMGLPLIDGILVALVVSGQLNSIFEMIQVGVLVFGGVATVTTVISEFNQERSTHIKRTLLFGILLSALAFIQALMAPTILSVVDKSVLHRSAVIALVVFALKQAPYERTSVLPSPSIPLLIGLVIGADPLSLKISYSSVTAGLYAAGAVLIGIIVVTVCILTRDRLSQYVDSNRLRKSSSVAIICVALSVIGILPSFVPLGIFAGLSMLSMR
jgi:hypothetical protein